MAMSQVVGDVVCNCMYGTQDPRCCINKGRQDELCEAWKAGRDGKPCPQPAGVRPIGNDKWVTGVLDGMGNAPARWVDND